MKLDTQTKKAVIEHIKNHVGIYPASSKTLAEACNNMSEFNTDVKKWFSKSLPAGTYKSPDQVLKALKLN